MVLPKLTALILQAEVVGKEHGGDAQITAASWKNQI